MTILVTGGTGFLGRYVIEAFLDQGENVTAFDMIEPGADLFSEAVADGRLRFIKGDISNKKEVTHAVAASDDGPIVHLAGILTTGCDRDPDLAMKVNFNGTWHILDAALKHKRPVTFASTISVYGRGLAQPITEDMATEPDGWYGLTKLMAEQTGLLYVRRHALDFRVVRLAAVTGPGRSAASGSASLYTSFIPEKAALGDPYTIEVSPETSYPVVYVKDAASAIVTLSNTQTVQNRIFNIASGSVTTSALVSIVKGKIPDAQFDYKPDPMVMAIVQGFQDWEIDCASAEEELGWLPQYEIQAMVDDIISEAMKRRHL